MSKEAINLHPIGLVHSRIKTLEGCPHWQDSGPEAELEIFAEYAPGLDGMQPGQKIILFTWLHLAARAPLHRDKRSDPEEPPRGVFCSRSPVRPNPIGQHEVTVVSVERGDGPARLRVNALEALDGTPILDIKTGREFFFGEDHAAMQHGRTLLAALCRQAAAKGLLPGCSGNASLRMASYALVTPSGRPKEKLNPEDLVPVRIRDGRVAQFGASPSSERGLHLEIYKSQPEAMAILHTHPAALTALGILLPGKGMEDRLNLPVFECETLRKKISTVPDFAPGTDELAQAAARAAASGKRLIWLERHGLCVWGASADEALALSDECEHLARVAVLSLPR